MAYIIAIDLNFALSVAAFLCLENPMVIKITAIRLISGCSSAYNLNVLSFIATEKDCNEGVTKDNMRPTNSCTYVEIYATYAVFRSLSLNCLLDDSPIIAFIEATINKINAA